jgi:hypothetical protein
MIRQLRRLAACAFGNPEGRVAVGRPGAVDKLVEVGEKIHLMH